MKIPIFPSKYHQNGGFSMGHGGWETTFPGTDLLLERRFFEGPVLQKYHPQFLSSNHAKSFITNHRKSHLKTTKRNKSPTNQMLTNTCIMYIYREREIIVYHDPSKSPRKKCSLWRVAFVGHRFVLHIPLPNVVGAPGEEELPRGQASCLDNVCLTFWNDIKCFHKIKTSWFFVGGADFLFNSEILYLLQVVMDGSDWFLIHYSYWISTFPVFQVLSSDTQAFSAAIGPSDLMISINTWSPCILRKKAHNHRANIFVPGTWNLKNCNFGRNKW